MVVTTMSSEIGLCTTGADQTATASALRSWKEPYSVKVKQLEGRSATFPTLQSFSAGHTSDGQWLLLGGRTNGLHKFTPNSKKNFPAAHQNSRVWVYDPKLDRSWSRSLAQSGLNASKQLSLSTTNAQQLQQGEVLFRVGGYVYDAANQTFSTRNRLSAINIDNLAVWAKRETKRVPKQTVLSVAGEAMQVNKQQTHFFAVTGGELLAGEQSNQALLTFGQDFQGGYTFGSNGIYTEQVRNFSILYDPKKGKLDYKVNSVSAPDQNRYHRRDLNIVNQLQIGKNGELARQGLALGGVFYKGEGVYTVPAEIDLLTGEPTMTDANNKSTFRQAVNQYSAANLGLYSRSNDEQTNLIFGGISAVILNPQGDPYYVNPDRDPNLAFSYPFTSQIAALKHKADGNWKQSLAGSFPSLKNAHGQSLTYGASSAFMPLAEGEDKRVSYLADGILDLDRLRSLSEPGAPVHVGYVVGGIESQVADNFNDLSTYGNSNYTVASGEIFKVFITPS